MKYLLSNVSKWMNLLMTMTKTDVGNIDFYLLLWIGAWVEHTGGNFDVAPTHRMWSDDEHWKRKTHCAERISAEVDVMLYESSSFIGNGKPL